MSLSRYRAWDKENSRMVYPSTDDVYFVLTDDGINILDMSLEPFDDVFPRLDAVLMQSTGLKDLKGVEIFERDVVWIIDKGEMDNGWGWFEEVKFRNGSFMAGDDFLINSHHRCVVHGNIHENPELLSQGIE